MVPNPQNLKHHSLIYYWMSPSSDAPIICGILWPAGARTRPSAEGGDLGANFAIWQAFGKLGPQSEHVARVRLECRSVYRCQSSAKELTGVLASALNSCFGVSLVHFIAFFGRSIHESTELRRFRAPKHHKRLRAHVLV